MWKMISLVVTATLSNSEFDKNLQGVPELVGIIEGRWIHQANHNFFEVMREVLF